MKGQTGSGATLEDLVRNGIVSRESSPDFEAYIELLLHWQSRINLIGPGSVADVWCRHVANSLSLMPHLQSDAPVIADLGSGAGFPGLAVAIALKTRPGALVHLVEANGKKAAFLREAVRVTEAPGTVVEARIESLDSDALHPEPSLLTARALAPLPKLIEMSRKWLKKGAIGLFLKGQDVDRELTGISKYPNIRIEKLAIPQTEAGVILKVKEVTP